MKKGESYTFHYFESSFRGRASLAFDKDMALSKINSREKWSYIGIRTVSTTQKTICRKKVTQIIVEINEQGYSILNCIKTITIEK